MEKWHGVTQSFSKGFAKDAQLAANSVNKIFFNFSTCKSVFCYPNSVKVCYNKNDTIR